jgi:phosphoglycolate phosphatase-like HAD superfamily hydrolase
MSTTPKTETLSGKTLLTGQHSHHGHHRARRIRNFMLPNGREVHIALSPEEAETLRQRLEAVRSNEEPFDLVISGSPEHLEALREAHGHHERRRDTLKETHGAAYDEFEHVRAELDALGSELHILTDHSVSLDANFSKYGYSAHLRTYDDGSPPESSRSSISGGFHNGEHEKKDWEKERGNGKNIAIYNKVLLILE